MLTAAVVVTALSVLLSPIVHFWYFFWVLPFVAGGQLAPPARRVATALVGMLGLLAPFDVSEHLPHALEIMLVGIFGVLLALLDPRQVRERLLSRGAGAT